MSKYRKKPVVIEAMQFTGENNKDCEKFIGGSYDNTLNYPNINTLEGVMRVSVGDWIIKGVHLGTCRMCCLISAMPVATPSLASHEAPMPRGMLFSKMFVACRPLRFR